MFWLKIVLWHKIIVIYATNDEKLKIAFRISSVNCTPELTNCRYSDATWKVVEEPEIQFSPLKNVNCERMCFKMLTFTWDFYQYDINSIENFTKLSASAWCFYA